MVSSFILSSNQVVVAGRLPSDFPVALLPGNQPDQSSFFQFFIRRVEFQVIADILPGKVFQYTSRFSHDVDGRNHDED